MPSNEEKLVNLKSTIAENQVTLAKLRSEVNSVYEFILVMEDYCHKFDDDQSNFFWDLK